MKKKPTLKPRGVRISDDHWKQINAKAKENKVRPSDVIREAIKSYFTEKPEPDRA